MSGRPSAIMILPARTADGRDIHGLLLGGPCDSRPPLVTISKQGQQALALAWDGEPLRVGWQQASNAIVVAGRVSNPSELVHAIKRLIARPSSGAMAYLDRHCAVLGTILVWDAEGNEVTL